MYRSKNELGYLSTILYCGLKYRGLIPNYRRNCCIPCSLVGNVCNLEKTDEALTFSLTCLQSMVNNESGTCCHVS
jgi:hypothetical protein